MDNMKGMKKIWNSSLAFLDNCYLNAIIVIILVLYSSTIFDNINSFIGNMYNFSIVKLIVLLLIIYVTPKDPTIGILLAVSYLVSLKYSEHYENFTHQKKHHNKESFSLPGFQSPDERESFVPFSDSNSSSFDMKFPNIDMGSKSSDKFDMKFPNVDMGSKSSDKFDMKFPNIDMSGKSPDKMQHHKVNSNEACMQNYVPKFESVGNVCSPTATFKNELNAQGLNFPEGFNSPDIGSPLSM